MRGWVPAYLRIGPLFLGTRTGRTCVYKQDSSYLSQLCVWAAVAGLPVLIEQSRARLFGLDFLE